MIWALSKSLMSVCKTAKYADLELNSDQDNLRE
jgi:hypothetical protein